MVKCLVLVVAVVAGCSTKANPNACCVSADDCKQAGLSDVKSCGQGLTCVNNQCLQETCSTDGCMITQPVCNVVSNVCEGCTDSSQCASYQGATVCDTTSGGCVGCVGPSDCPTDKPVCDMNTCRACVADADCASGACGDNGSCLDAGALIYVDQAGTDTGSCTRSAPCKTLGFAVTQANAMRSHIVMAPGNYVEEVNIGSIETTALSLTIHGGDATMSTPSNSDGNTINVNDVSTTIHDLNFVGNNSAGGAISTKTTPCAIYRVKVMGHGYESGFSIGGNTLVHDVDLAQLSHAIALTASAHLTLDRAIIQGGYMAIEATEPNTRVDITNTLVFDTSGGLNLTGAQGSVGYSTIADSGTVNGTNPIAVRCSSGLSFTSSIVWTPQAPGYAPIGGGCALNAVIAGPGNAAGAMNVDPMFVDEAHRDYHLGSASVARDSLGSGPATDYEGDSRPQGSGYDIGADEAK
jgi:hypothetical protein